MSDLLCFSLREMLPDRKGLVVMLKAFFDESQRPDGTFCVAGLVFAPSQAIKFVAEWKGMLDGRKVWHTKDVVHGRGEFKGLATSERDAFLVEAVSIIRKRARFGVIAACNINEISPSLARQRPGFNKPYPLCCNFCLTAVGKWLSDSGRTDQVFYLFEQGHGDQGDADTLMNAIRRHRSAKMACHYYSHGFAPKDHAGAVALQAADLLAWEYGKFKEETVEKAIRRSRGSFRALILNKRFAHYAAHVTSGVMDRYAAQIERITRNRQY